MPQEVTEAVKCPQCGSTEWTFAGWQWRAGQKNVHRRRCSREGCGKVFVLPPENNDKKESK